MLFSVIIPTYNRRDLFKQALDSVWAQTLDDYEVIVVDDGSDDGTWDELQRTNSRICALRQQHAGPGAARNLGAERSRGEYLAFLDSDDLWFPWTLACFDELIRQHDRPAILGARLVEFSDEAELAAVKGTPLQADVFPDFFASHRTSYFVGAGMSVLRREAFLKTGGYTDKPINAEDHDLILRMGTAKGFVQITAPVTLGWRRHSESATMDHSRNAAGSFFLIEQERLGAYPGGLGRRRERLDILTRHVRPTSLACLSGGSPKSAWRLYRATIGWHIPLFRWKFLLGFPIRALATPVRGRGVAHSQLKPPR